MVGHTGVIPAVVQAVETADACLGRVVARSRRWAASASSRPTTATPSSMLEADGVSPHTAHTTNPVPLVVTLPRAPSSQEGGALADLVPTASGCSGLPAAGEMTGRNLVSSV